MLYEFIFEPAPRLRQHRRKVGFGSILLKKAAVAAQRDQ